MNEKTKWTSLLFLATLLFLIGMVTKQPLFFIGTVSLAFLVHQKGYTILFKEYDDKQKAKRKKSELIMKKIQKKNKNEHGGNIK